MVTLMYEGIEKREFLRVDYNAKVNIDVLEEDRLRTIPDSFTKNVSACGLLVESDVSFAIGQTIVVRLDLHTLSNVIEIDDSVIEVSGCMLARVVRIEEYVVERKFGLGLCFLRKQELENETEVDRIVQLIDS